LLTGKIDKSKSRFKTELEYEMPEDWSKAGREFLAGCLTLNPNARLGHDGCYEVKKHPWFDNFSWEDLRSGVMKAPFVPESIGEFEDADEDCVIEKPTKVKSEEFKFDDYRIGAIDEAEK
jgi:hypothetical protein